MVEYQNRPLVLNFDDVFQALSDSTRRDILSRVLAGEQCITDLAQRYSMSFAAVAKHLDVLVRAQLVIKVKKGREQMVSANPDAVRQTTELLQQYEQIWRARLNNLDKFLATTQEGQHDNS
jgi:DNA-binding transcriptional ArsR family regulator